MTKIKIEIDVSDLINRNVLTPEKTKTLPTVPVDFDNLSYLNNQKTWYTTYTKGSRWVRMEGKGSDPTSCTDIIIRMSPGNDDTLIDEEMCYSEEYGTVAYDDYPENMYIQIERLRQLESQNYVIGDTNFVKLIE